MRSHGRRIFLKQSSTLVAAAAVGLTFKSNLTRALSFPADNRHFEILIIGDSVLWGQGLAMEHKFTYRIKKWLESVLPERDIRMKVEAHSGATIERINDHSDEGDNDACTQGYNGEVNRSSPSIPKQVELALEHYQLEEISTNDIDLIFVDGGINDISKGKLLLPRTNPEKVKEEAWKYCGTKMCNLLDTIATKFPNARIVVTGYFRLITENTPPNFVKNALRIALGREPNSEDSEMPSDDFQRILGLSRTWKTESDNALAAAVAETNRRNPFGSAVQAPLPEDQCKPCELCPTQVVAPVAFSEATRAIFVGVDFGADNGYAAANTYLWKLVRAEGKLKCPNHSILDWLTRKLITNDEVSPERSCRCVEAKAGKLVCVRAAAFHPNVNGADSYYRAVKEQLERFLGFWKA